MKLKALVKEVMKTDVKTVEYDTPIKAAAEIMKENIIGSVVVTGAKKVKGILTAEDIVYRHVAEGQGNIVSDIMSSELITISPNLTLDDASRLMTEKCVKKLPVLENGKLVGIITATDIVRIEPALHEVLIERMRIGGSLLKKPKKGGEFIQCESCGNYTDDIEEIDGEWICADCEEEKEKMQEE